MFVSSSHTISRFAGTGPGTFATTATTLPANLTNPNGLAFDARGDLFVADPGQSVIKELPLNPVTNTFGTATLFAGPGLSLSAPTGLVFDAHGDLFLAVSNGFNSGSITEFAAGGTPGTFGKTSTFTDSSLGQVEGLAVNAHGDLFAANNVNNTITEFASTGQGTFGAATTLSGGGLDRPSGLAFDALGDLFAADNVKGTITEFASTGQGTFKSGTTFAPGLVNPEGLAFDTLGDLFSANETGTITKLAFNPATGMFGVAQIIETEISPSFLVFGPSVPPAIPEASTTVSFGLLLAMGLGGLVIAARRKKA